MGNSFGTHSYTFDGIPVSWAATLMQIPDLRREIFVTLEEINKGCVKRTKVTRVVQKKDAELIREEKMIDVNIRAGCGEGTNIRFEKEGDQFLNKTPSDVVFVVRQKPHQYFVRDGNDITYTAKISLQQALYGTAVTVPSIHGKSIRLVMPEGVSSTTVQIYNGHGLPSLDDPLRRGKMYVRFEIDEPQHHKGDDVRERLIPDKPSHANRQTHGDGKVSSCR